MSLKQAAAVLQQQGRNGDTELVHMTRGEVAAMQGLAAAAGGSLTRNPVTGLPEASFLKNLLPTILGAGAMFIPGMQPMGAAMLGGAAGALTNKDDPLMGMITGGLGGFGGAGLMGGLQGLGAGAAQQAAMQGAQQTAAQQMAQQGAQMMAGGVDPGLVNALRPEMLNPALQAASNTAAADATNAFLQSPASQQLLGGGKALMQPGGASAYMQGLGGPMATAKQAGMAVAPLLMAPPSGGGGGPQREKRELPEFEFDAGFTGGVGSGPATAERQWFRPAFRRV
jgi:hypothetical protein